MAVRVEERVRVRLRLVVELVVVVVRLSWVKVTVRREEAVLPVTSQSAIVLVRSSVVTSTSSDVLVLKRSTVAVVVDVCRSNIFNSTHYMNIKCKMILLVEV